MSLGQDAKLKRYASEIVRDYCHELVLLNCLYERKLLSEDEMLLIRQDISKSYGVVDSFSLLHLS